jgi:putative endonuclease
MSSAPASTSSGSTSPANAIEMTRARTKAYRSGVFAETLAALLYRLKGYRIVARRYRSPVVEIDLVAPKGRRLAFVEVKRRKTREDAAWTDFVGHTIAFDVVLTAPWRFPQHIVNAFPV